MLELLQTGAPEAVSPGEEIPHKESSACAGVCDVKQRIARQKMLWNG